MSLDAVPQTTANQIGNDLRARFAEVAAYDMPLAIAVADTILEDIAPAFPEVAPVFGMTSLEAEWWCEFASDTMVVAMLSACLKRVTEQRVIAQGARKRAMVAIWNTLNEKDRIAFLEMVDPGAAGKE
jgi:hypothetical protein